MFAHIHVCRKFLLLSDRDTYLLNSSIVKWDMNSFRVKCELVICKPWRGGRPMELEVSSVNEGQMYLSVMTTITSLVGTKRNNPLTKFNGGVR